MRYGSFKDGLQLSKLGLGTMRLPQTEPGFGKPVDMAQAEALVDYCMAQGINYYDTAYVYHGGKSEEVLGQALSKYPRDSFYVADKFNIQADPDYRAVFQEQLSRLGMDSIDFYLLHAVTDQIASDYERCGCIPYYQELKQSGKIRYLGFSFHGTPSCLRQMLDLTDWDFVQIQLNYYDWFQGTAREQYEILREKNIPIMVMEPIHGGMLASLPEECMKLLPENGLSPAALALRFVMELPGVAVVLSGMSAREQAEENVATAAMEKSPTEQDLACLEQVSSVLRRKVAVPCTACRYCCDDCPQGLDIPTLLAAYNEYCDEAVVLGDRAMAIWRLFRLKGLPEEKQPKACIGCGSCMAHCPQGIDIPACMKEMAEILQ